MDAAVAKPDEVGNICSIQERGYRLSDTGPVEM